MSWRDKLKSAINEIVDTAVDAATSAFCLREARRRRGVGRRWDAELPSHLVVAIIGG